jgi:preprotein translocase subunit SecF
MHLSKHLKYIFIPPLVLAVLSLGVIAAWGLKPGIELAGGSLLQVTYPQGRPGVEVVRAATAKLNLGEVRVQPSGTNGYILRQRDLTTDEKAGLESSLSALGTMQEDQFTSIGPSIGAELAQKAWVAIGLVVLCIVAFIAFAFRKVSRPVAAWKFGLVAVGTLLFDVLVPVGMFALLGHLRGAEVDSLFIVALLTILGISINDKIVVFDRIRENLLMLKNESFGDTVDRSVTQTLSRSINTSMTVVIMLLALYFLGPQSTQAFALTLTVGMIVGTYSSIFLAAPLLVAWQKWQSK